MGGVSVMIRVVCKDVFLFSWVLTLYNCLLLHLDQDGGLGGHVLLEQGLALSNSSGMRWSFVT